MAKLTKKATQKIIELVQAIKPGTGKNTSFDEAWNIISEYVGIEIEMTCDIKDNTIIVLYKEDKEIGRLNINNSYIREKGDWDWNIIYKDIIEYMMKNKIVRKPKLKNKSISNGNNIIYNKDESVADGLKKRKQTLYMKIRSWKKKGKDVSELEKEYKLIIESLSNIK